MLTKEFTYLIHSKGATACKEIAEDKAELIKTGAFVICEGFSLGGSEASLLASLSNMFFQYGQRDPECFFTKL